MPSPYRCGATSAVCRFVVPIRQAFGNVGFETWCKITKKRGRCQKMRLIFRNNFSIFKTNKNFILEKNRGFFAFHVQKGIVSFVGCDGLIVFFFTFLYISLGAFPRFSVCSAFAFRHGSGRFSAKSRRVLGNIIFRFRLNRLLIFPKWRCNLSAVAV